jgi:hypothetical protein
MPTEIPKTDAHRTDEELVCVDSLKHVLRVRGLCQNIQIDRLEDDPPDFIVTVDGESFPTEVTAVVSRQHYHAHCTEFAEAINIRAKALAILSGSYALTIRREPIIPKTKSPDGRRALDAALSYIEATKHLGATEEFHLAQEHGGTISIAKISITGSVVGLVWTARAMWGSEICEKLTDLIQQRVDDKKKKLSEKGIGAGKALLLLYAAFAYADTDHAIESLNLVHGYDWFHSVFWAASFADRENTTYPSEPGREGLFLFSAKPEWHRVGTITNEAGT